jgi:hypothetical protein
MMRSVQRVAYEDRVVACDIERAVGLVGEIVAIESGAAPERDRLVEVREFRADNADGTFRWHG